MTAPAFLATSLAPGRDLALQRAAVASWREAGFAVLSVNAAAELPQLTRDHPDVTFVTATTTGEKIAGKPVPYVHDLLKALHAAALGRGVPLTDCLVGIINDDIHFRVTAANMTAICRAAQGALLLGPRVDVADGTALGRFAPSGKETYSVGYDYFLMSGDLLNDFSKSPFCIGMPFWDFWLPLMSLLHGRPLKALQSPVALHIAHETRWDSTIYVFFHALIADVLQLCKATQHGASAADRQFGLLVDLLSHIYNDVFERGTTPGANGQPQPGGVETLAAFYDRFQEVAVHHIKSRAQVLSL